MTTQRTHNLQEHIHNLWKGLIKELSRNWWRLKLDAMCLYYLHESENDWHAASRNRLDEVAVFLASRVIVYSKAKSTISSLQP